MTKWRQIRKKLIYVNDIAGLFRYTFIKLCPFGGFSVNTKDFLRESLALPDGEFLQEAASVCHLQTVRKGELLVQQGQALTQLFLVRQGVFRGFFSDVNGKDITDCFAYQPGEPCMPSSDLTEKAPISIEAMVDATVVSVSIGDFFRLMERYPALHEVYLRFVLQASKRHWQLKIISYQYTAMQRYAWFLENYPGLIDKVSHKYVASFLNMTPVTLSRLINGRNADKGMDQADDGP